MAMQTSLKLSNGTVICSGEALMFNNEHSVVMESWLRCHDFFRTPELESGVRSTQVQRFATRADTIE